MDKLTNFWDNCDPVFSHISISGYLKDFESLSNSWEKNFANHYNFKDKTVIDYGIGGGYLGLYLFENRGISKYIGFDISKRQLNAAKENLGNRSVELYLVDNNTKFDTYNADIFICQAVIQHFPNEKYLINFLDKVNESNINEIMLQIRYNEKTVFSDDYTDLEGVRLACQTNSDYILNYLTNYELVKNKKIDGKANYEFLFFTKTA